MIIHTCRPQTVGWKDLAGRRAIVGEHWQVSWPESEEVKENKD